MCVGLDPFPFPCLLQYLSSLVRSLSLSLSVSLSVSLSYTHTYKLGWAFARGGGQVFLSPLLPSIGAFGQRLGRQLYTGKHCSINSIIIVTRLMNRAFQDLHQEALVPIPSADQQGQGSGPMMHPGSHNHTSLHLLIHPPHRIHPIAPTYSSVAALDGCRGLE